MRIAEAMAERREPGRDNRVSQSEFRTKKIIDAAYIAGPWQWALTRKKPYFHWTLAMPERSHDPMCSCRAQP